MRLVSFNITKIVKIVVVFIFAFVGFISENNLYAQKERQFIRSGNESYEKGDFVNAEVDYLRAIDRDSTSYAAKFNLANALYKQKKYDEAFAKFSMLAADSINTEHRHKSYYNLGNTLFQQKKYGEAIDAYKSSLRINPSDTTAKFNLAYAQLMNQQQQQNDQNKDNKDDQNKDKDKDKDNKDDQDKDNKDDKNKDDQDKDKDKDNKDDQDKDKDKDKDNKDDKNKDQKDDQNKDDKQDQQDGGGQQPEPKLSKKEAEQLLKAIQNNEDKTQEKVKDKKGVVVVGGSKKNW